MNLRRSFYVAETAKALKKRVRREEKRVSDLNGIIKKLYESYAMGKIPEKRFDALSAEYEKEQAALEESVAKAKAELADFEAIPCAWTSSWNWPGSTRTSPS